MGKLVQIRLFGAFAVRVGDEVVPEGAWRLRKAKSLVKLLALAPEHRVHRERATELLWPERAPKAAANNFHQALYVARRALEAAGADASVVLPLRDDMLALDPGGEVEVDVDAFEAAVAHARETGELSDYHAALELHRGELLPEDAYEAWVAARREALSEAHLGLLLELSARRAEGGDTAGAIEALEQVLVIDALHEGAHRALMRLFAGHGRRQQALAQYHQLRDALRRDLEAEPDPQTARLYRALLRGEAESDPPEPELRQQAARASRGRPAESARHNLPIALTSFIGRDRELRELARLLDRNRLVSLTGAGGRQDSSRPGGCDGAGERMSGRGLRVELAGLSDPTLVPAATASAVGLTLPSSDRPRRPQRSAGPVARAADPRQLRASDRGLRRPGRASPGRLPGAADPRHEPGTLRVPGEVTWRVPSLALPVPGRSLKLEELAAYESIRRAIGHDVAAG